MPRANQKRRVEELSQLGPVKLVKWVSTSHRRYALKRMGQWPLAPLLRLYGCNKVK